MVTNIACNRSSRMLYVYAEQLTVRFRVDQKVRLYVLKSI